MLTHLLTHPLHSPVNGAVCGERLFTAATDTPTRVTCPQCLAGTRPHDARGQTRLTPGRPLPGIQSEKQWLQQVLTVAREHHWLAYHTRNSQQSAPGWPDVALARAGSPLYLVELKTSLGHLSGHQRHWLETLLQTSGLVVDVWRPGDLETILEVLR